MLTRTPNLSTARSTSLGPACVIIPEGLPLIVQFDRIDGCGSEFQVLYSRFDLNEYDDFQVDLAAVESKPATQAPKPAVQQRQFDWSSILLHYCSH